MFTEEERRLVLPKGLGDRVLAVVFGCILTGFFAQMHTHLEQKVTKGWLDQIVHGVAIEAMVAFGIFTGLAALWALFTPRWLEYLVQRSARKVLASIVLVLVATVFAVLFSVR